MTIEETQPKHPPTVPGELSSTMSTHEETEPARGWSAFNLLWMSLLAVAVWPLLAIAGCHHLFDDLSEAAIVFGGFIACLLYPIALLAGPSDIAFMVGVMLVWLLLWLIPIGWLTKYPRGRGFQTAAIAILSGISLMQAALGYLMILGKGV